MVVTDGFDPSVSGLSARRSDHLSYATMNDERGGGYTHNSDSRVTQFAAARLHEQGVHWILSALGFKLLFLNGQENGLRSRGLVHPEHVLCQLSYFLFEMMKEAGVTPTTPIPV